MLHGDAIELRRAVVDVLLEEKDTKAGFRYACCGLADQLAKRGGDVFVSPKGCGHKLCPRCGRRRGGKYAKRIIGWLARRPHGDLWSVVLTQAVKSGESLKDARARMARKQRAYMRWLTGRGMTAGMTAVHIVWSMRSDGWHYHVHVLANMPRGSTSKVELLQRWEVESAGEKVRTGDEQCRLVVSAGGPIRELAEDGGDADFWHESVSAVARAVQYPLRDLVQGVSAWRLGGDGEKMRRCARELVRDATGWKCFRAWGEWRKAAPAEEEAPTTADDAGADGAGSPGPAVPLGFVGRLWRAARGGDQAARLALEGLERSVKNDSEFAKRLIGFCRSALCPTQVHGKG